MTENDKDAQTETNMDHNTQREANSQTLSLSPTVGGMEVECKSFYVDRLDNRNSDRRWNNERDGLGWGEVLGSHSVSLSVCL